MVIEITPAQLHMHLDVLLSAGRFPIRTVGEPGAQGVIVMGMQGIGVRTPMAAAVAEATVGLARLVHMPKGVMFIMGLWSMMLAAGWFPTIVRFNGATISVEGATPKEH